MKIVALVISWLVFGVSCDSLQVKPVKSQVARAKDSLRTSPKFTMAMVVNQKDLSCYMPLADGIADTVHYNGKAYGFCSKECKNEFLKNPAYYVK